MRPHTYIHTQADAYRWLANLIRWRIWLMNLDLVTPWYWRKLMKPREYYEWNTRN